MQCILVCYAYEVLHDNGKDTVRYKDIRTNTQQIRHSNIQTFKHSNIQTFKLPKKWSKVFLGPVRGKGPLGARGS
jgi:hypothetical protein